MKGHGEGMSVGVSVASMTKGLGDRCELRLHRQFYGRALKSSCSVVLCAHPYYSYPAGYDVVTDQLSGTDG